MKTTTLMLALGVSACQWTPVVPERNGDAEAICRALERLGCDEAKPTPDGTPCTRVFTDVAESGVDLAGARECVERASNCGVAAAC